MPPTSTWLSTGLSEDGAHKARRCHFTLGPFVLPPALRLHGERAAHPAAVHRDRRRPPPATTCLLPGPPHHRQDRLHRQPRSHAIQHQNPGDPAPAGKQHESHVSAGIPLFYLRILVSFLLSSEVSCSGTSESYTARLGVKTKLKKKSN